MEGNLEDDHDDLGTDRGQVSDLDALPDEVIVEIASHLDIQSLRVFSTLSIRLHDISGEAARRKTRISRADARRGFEDKRWILEFPGVPHLGVEKLHDQGLSQYGLKCAHHATAELDESSQELLELSGPLLAYLAALVNVNCMILYEQKKRVAAAPELLVMTKWRMEHGALTLLVVLATDDDTMRTVFPDVPKYEVRQCPSLKLFMEKADIRLRIVRTGVPVSPGTQAESTDNKILSSEAAVECIGMSCLSFSYNRHRKLRWPFDADDSQDHSCLSYAEVLGALDKAFLGNHSSCLFFWFAKREPSSKSTLYEMIYRLLKAD